MSGRSIHDLHDSSAQKRHTNHEGPARNDGKNPEEISKRNSKAILGEEAIEWMEHPLIWRLLLPCLRSVEIRECLDRGRCNVQVSEAHSDLARRRGHLKDLKTWWSGAPGVAKNWLSFAVEVTKMRS